VRKSISPLNTKTRSNWSNRPTGTTFQNGATERNGLKLGDMTTRTARKGAGIGGRDLESAGYEKVMNIVAADETLERTTARTRAAATRVRFGRAEYYVAILGEPPKQSHG
jgi:hypothetical protein